MGFFSHRIWNQKYPKKKTLFGREIKSKEEIEDLGRRISRAEYIERSNIDKYLEEELKNS